MSNDLGKKNILIVDDTRENLDVLFSILQDDYKVRKANSGKLAIKITKKVLPDLILLDVMMPEMDGFEVCAILKADPLTKDIPVIFVTAMEQDSDEVKGLKLGAVDYITKPINAPILLARVKTHIQLKMEKDKSEKLIRNVLPSAVVEELKMTGKTSPVSYEKAAVFFSDLVGFTRISANMSPQELIQELNLLFTEYDNIIESNYCERIKTIGDAYMAVSGLPVKNKYYADNIVKSAVEILSFLKIRIKQSKYPWTTTIGIDSGEVVGGVVGVKKFVYDIFGSTVNMASRLESASKIYKLEIIISDSIYNDLKNPDDFCLREIDTVRVKGGERVLIIYEVFDCDEEIIKEQKLKTKELFSEAISDYKSGRFSDALDKFNECSKECPGDSIPKIYIKRCSTLIRLPKSSDWEGISGI